MGVIKSLNQTSDRAIDIGETYYKKTQEYYKLKAFQQLTQIMGLFGKIFVIGSLALLGGIFFAVAGTLALANWLGSTVMACSIVGATILLIALIIFKTRRKVDAFVIKKLGKNFFE